MIVVYFDRGISFVNILTDVKQNINANFVMSERTIVKERTKHGKFVFRGRRGREHGEGREKGGGNGQGGRERG